MWPKNIVFYQLDPNKSLPGDIAERLGKHPFQKPAGLDWFSEGFIPPAAHTAMAHQTRGNTLFTLRRDDKILPAGVIRDALDAKLSDIEAAESRKLGRKEKLALKEQITDDLLPKSHTRSSRVSGWTNANWLLVDTGSRAKAENLISCLREAAPPFPAALVRTVTSPQALMTDWLASGEATGDFVLDSDATLQDGSENGAKIKVSRIDLTADEIKQHIATGKQVTSLGLIWRERIRFVLSDDLSLKRLQFLDVLQEEASQAGDDAASLFDATFLLMSEELGAMVDDLIDCLGGIADKDGTPAATVGKRMADEHQADGTVLPADMAVPFNGAAADDPLLPQAQQVITMHRRASISFVQRHLLIGYNRAARLIEHLEAQGVVSSMDALGNRMVLTKAEGAQDTPWE